jgi:hypothetical protein
MPLVSLKYPNSIFYGMRACEVWQAPEKEAEAYTRMPMVSPKTVAMLSTRASVSRHDSGVAAHAHCRGKGQSPGSM